MGGSVFRFRGLYARKGGLFLGVDSQPIFVVGMPRSGTTLLAALLSAHSEIAIGPETAYFDLVWKPLEREQGLTQWGKVEARLKEFFVKPSVALMNLPEADLLEEFRLASERQQLSHRKMLSRMMQMYAALQKKTRWGEKTPGHFLYLPAIKSEFPEAEIIYIVRDPRDIHLSLANVAWNDGNAFNHALQWREYQAISVRYQKRYGHSFTQVLYEDLITDPTNVLRQLTSQVGISFEEGMLERYQTQPLFDVKDEPWKRKVASPIDASNAGKWRTQLPSDELGIFSRLCGSQLVELGYDLPKGSHFVVGKALKGLDVHAVMWWGRIAWRIAHDRDPWLGHRLSPSS